MKMHYTIKIRILLVTFSLLLLSPYKTEGQEQKSVLDNISDKLQKYCSLYPWEEIYLHTDRMEYVAGEDIWFKTYLIDRQTFRLTGSSRIVYVEILNPANRPVVQKRIGLEEGTGPGQLSLPDTLSSGYYTLRAYTNWMKNFLPENCFSKKLKIYNALNTRRSFGKPAENKLNSRGYTPAEDGISIGINNTNPETVEITIRTNQIYRIRNGNKCYMVIETRGSINSKRELNLSGDNLIIDVQRGQLLTGINHLTLFNAAGKPVAERLMFSKPSEDKNYDVLPDENAGPRQKISFELRNEIISGKTGKTPELSVSVSDAGRNDFPGIADYMIFGSEFGTIPDEFITSGILNVPSPLIEKYLSEIRSSWIDWNRIISDNPPAIKYLRESENHFIYGKLLNRNSQSPDSNKFLFLSLPGKNAIFQYGLTDKEGDFYFKIPIDDKIRDIIIQPEESDRNNNIKIESSFSDDYSLSTPLSDTVRTPEEPSIPKLAINYQVMKIYGSDDLPVTQKPVSFTEGSKRFYGKPDIEIVMDDYIKLPVMQEVFFELMPGFFLKKKKNDYEITIMDPIENKIYDRPPVLMVDGVVVNDPNLIANIDPEKVEKIDGIKSRYFVGNYLLYGLVNIITRAGDLSVITLPDYAVRLPYRTVEPVKDFTGPDYSTEDLKKSRKADFRNTLYWNPSVQASGEGNANISFWTSDYRSDFEVNIQGLSSDGNFVSIKKTIRVK